MRCETMGKSLLEELRAKRDIVFSKLVELVANEQVVDLKDPDVRAGIEAEVEEMTEDWMKAEGENVRGIAAETPLQRLLAEHYQLGEQIMDLRDQRFD